MLSRSFLVFALTGGCAASAVAATAPYSRNFDSDAQGTVLPSDFLETVGAGTADYSIEPDLPTGNVLQGAISATTATTGTTPVGANGSAAVTFPGLAGNNFTISTEFVIDDFISTGTDNTINLGLAALGTQSNFSAGSNYRLLYTVVNPGNTATGKITLGEIGATGTALSGSSAGVNAVLLDTVYTLTLAGTYNAGALTLTGTLTGGDGTALTVTATDTTPLAGSFFGYRTAVNALRGATQATGAAVASQNIDYDNFSVIPEPSAVTGLLGGCGLLAGLGRLRRGLGRR